MEKDAYIRQLRALIKQYHPDRCQDEHLEAVYHEITVQLNQILARVKGQAERQEAERGAAARGQGAREQAAAGGGDGALVPADQAYTYYRLGIRYYRNIHPDQFYQRTRATVYQLKNYDEQLRALNTIFVSFNLAEHYFRKIITEYPDSEWFADAKEKLRLLKRLYKSYEGRTPELPEANPMPYAVSQAAFVQEMGLKML